MLYNLHRRNPLRMSYLPTEFQNPSHLLGARQNSSPGWIKIKQIMSPFLSSFGLASFFHSTFFSSDFKLLAALSGPAFVSSGLELFLLCWFSLSSSFISSSKVLIETGLISWAPAFGLASLSVFFDGAYEEVAALSGFYCCIQINLNYLYSNF